MKYKKSKMNLLFQSSLKVYKFLLVVTITLVSISCTNEATKISYEAAKSLEPNKVNVQGGDILYPSGLDVLDSSLLIIDGKLDSSKFKFFGLESFDLITSFGKEGRGPDEFSDIILSPVSTTVNDRVQIFDWSNKRLVIYDIDNDTKQFDYSKYIEYTLPPQLMLSQNAAFINDTTIISSGSLTSGLFAFTNTKSDESEYINALNYDLEELNEREKGYLFESVVAVNAKQKLIAVAPRFVPQLYIFDFDGELISSHALSEEFDLNKFDDIANKKGIFYGVAASNDHIYVAHVGKTLNEMDDIIENNDHNDVNFTNLYLFDWEGEFLKSYQLLGGSYRSMYADEANNRIYSLDLLTSSIVYFELD